MGMFVVVLKSYSRPQDVGHNDDSDDSDDDVGRQCDGNSQRFPLLDAAFATMCLWHVVCVCLLLFAKSARECLNKKL